MPLPARVARFNRRVTNRITGRFADRLPGFAIVVHKGRRSGRTYRTPVNAFRDGNDYIIILTYGPDTDWVRNVLAAGSAELVTRGRRVNLTNPRIITDKKWRWAPLPLRLIFDLLGAIAGVSQYMRLSPVSAPPASGATDTRDADTQPRSPAASR